MDFKRPARSQPERTGREDRHPKFYELRDKLVRPRYRVSQRNARRSDTQCGEVILVLVLVAVLAPTAEAKKRWYPLRFTTVEIGGDSYTQGFWYRGDGGYDFNLRRKCSKLSFVAGVTDDSPQDSALEFTVSEEGGELDSFSADFGEVVRRVWNVRGVLKVEFRSADLNPESQAWAGWGKVRAYRSRRPASV